MTDVVGKLWGFCHTLRHDGIDYGDYIEQLTYLLFLKMADERGLELPEDTDWPYLRKQSGTALLDAYIEALRTLGRQPGILGDIFSGCAEPLHQPGQPAEAHRPHRRDRVDRARHRCQGRRLRGPPGEGGRRGQEGCGPVLHAPSADPEHGPLHQARPAGQQGLRHRRPGLRHRRLPRRRLRVAARSRPAAPSTARRRSASASAPTSARSSSPGRADSR